MMKFTLAIALIAGVVIAGQLTYTSAQVENAVIVAIICDRGDRYLSTGVFSAAE